MQKRKFTSYTVSGGGRPANNHKKKKFNNGSGVVDLYNQLEPTSVSDILEITSPVCKRCNMFIETNNNLQLCGYMNCINEEIIPSSHLNKLQSMGDTKAHPRSNLSTTSGNSDEMVTMTTQNLSKLMLRYLEKHNPNIGYKNVARLMDVFDTAVRKNIYELTDHYDNVCDEQKLKLQERLNNELSSQYNSFRTYNQIFTSPPDNQNTYFR